MCVTSDEDGFACAEETVIRAIAAQAVFLAIFRQPVFQSASSIPVEIHVSQRQNIGILC